LGPRVINVTITTKHTSKPTDNHQVTGLESEANLKRVGSVRGGPRLVGYYIVRSVIRFTHVTDCIQAGNLRLVHYSR